MCTSLLSMLCTVYKCTRWRPVSPKVSHQCKKVCWQTRQREISEITLERETRWNKIKCKSTWIILAWTCTCTFIRKLKACDVGHWRNSMRVLFCSWNLKMWRRVVFHFEFALRKICWRMQQHSCTCTCSVHVCNRQASETVITIRTQAAAVSSQLALHAYFFIALRFSMK